MIEFFKKIKQKFSFFISKDIVVLPEQGDVLGAKMAKDIWLRLLMMIPFILVLPWRFFQIEEADQKALWCQIK